MRTVAFFFERASAADEVRCELETVDTVDNGQIATAPLVVEGNEGTVLAVSVDNESRPAVESSAERHGGRLVVDVPQEWL